MGWPIGLYQFLCIFSFLLHSQLTCSSSFFSSSSSSSYAQQLCPHDQSLALLQFKTIFSFHNYSSEYCDISHPKMVSWKEGSDCCLWDGVTCDRVTGHVIGLDLSCSWLLLEDPIHSNSTLFLHLPHLQTLNLAFNNFNSSRISSAFGQFTSLTHLNLSWSDFYGQIPSEISHLSKLVSLDLSYNQNLRLEAPNFKLLAQNLTELRELILDEVNLSSVVPDSLMNLSSSWITLNLSGCGLRGKFPENIFHLPNLQTLNLRGNSDLTGHFPKLNWSSPLRLLDLSETSFYGGLPDSITNLKSLNALYLSDCQFSGSIPISLGNLTQITLLYLSYNHFNGQVPSSLSNLTQLVYLSFAYNQLTGPIPSHISGLSNLIVLDLSNNQLTGPIPFHISGLSNLAFLYLSNNKLTGPIPSQISGLSNLAFLYLSNNQLTGPIPSQISGLSNLACLDLSNNQLTSPIPSHISGLSNLIDLDLSNNQLTGPIPSQISGLSNLAYLDLSNNQLTGPIPSHISGLSNLIVLDLSSNSLNGTLPSWMFTLPSLQFFNLRQNQFTGHIYEFQSNSLEWIDLSSNKLHGPFPKSTFKLVNLTKLYLQSNNFTGSLEQDMFVKLKKLCDLDLSYNSLSLSTNNDVNFSLPELIYLKLFSCKINEFPSFLRALENLEELNLSNNKIQGQIPKWAYGMWKHSLSYLNLSHNFLTGLEKLPWKHLSYLDLRSNLFQGPLPIPQFATLLFFSISNNKLTGEIPPSICNVSSLEILDLSNNMLNGAIPQCLGNFSNSLSVLDLRMNSFHGTIPQTFVKGNSLRNLDLNSNQLEGPVPRSLLNCKMLEVLDLGNNQINGTFPYWLETLPELQVLVLRSNRFHGPIRGSEAKYTFPKLRIIDLSYNDFTGLLPTKYLRNFQAMMNVDNNKIRLQYMGDILYQDSVMVTSKGLKIELVKILTIFTTIDLSKNRFEGKIPISIGKLMSLRMLNFSHNNLTGYVPSSLGNLTVLESFDLSSNKLVGEIPSQLTDLTFLEVLNLSENNLEGPIPRGKQFDTFQNDSYSGNAGLCGSPLSKKCEEDQAQQPPQSIFQQQDDSEFASGFEWKVTLMGYGCGTILGLVIGYLMFSTGKPEWLVRIVEGELDRMVKSLKKFAQRRGGRRN